MVRKGKERFVLQKVKKQHDQTKEKRGEQSYTQKHLYVQWRNFFTNAHRIRLVNENKDKKKSSALAEDFNRNVSKSYFCLLTTPPFWLST